MNKRLEIDVLDLMASDRYSGNLLTRFTPMTLSPINVQAVPEQVSAFNLDPPSIGADHQAEINKTPSSGGVIARVSIPYLTAELMAKDINYFTYVMSLNINQALLAIERSVGGFGAKTTREITIQRPGEYSKFFSHLDNYAGYEVRFYSPKKENNQ